MDERTEVVISPRIVRDLAAHYDILPDAVLVESNGVWVYANPAAVSMLRYENVRELVGRPILDIAPAEDHEAILARRVRALEGTPNRLIRQRLVRADGVLIHAEISCQTIALARGTPSVMIVVRDISERLAQEELFRCTFEQAAVGIAHVSLDGHWLRVNRRLAQIAGYEQSELLGMSYVDLIHPEDLTKGQEQRARLFAGEIESFSAEKRHIRKDGTIVWVLVTVSVARHADGSPDYLIAVVQDIHERKKAEEAVRASEERFRHLVEFGSELIVVVEPGGTMSYIVPTVTSLLGYEPQDVIGLSAFAFIHPDDLPDSVARVARVSSTPGARERATIRIRSANDGWRTFEISTVNMLDDPSVAGIVINGHDATEGVRVVEELAQMKRVESLGRVAAAAAHEFNNVLAAADAFTTVLGRKADANVEPLVAGLKNAITRGKQITAPILHYGQPAGVAKTDFDVRQWLGDLRNDMEPLVAPRNPLSIHVSPQVSRVWADRRQLSQVITNLVFNARDASPPGAPIEISARRNNDGGLVLEVRDSGCGIPPAALERVFEPLFTTKSNGMGLGLAVVQQIVVRHGGMVTVESEAGRGTTFTVTLP